MAGIEPAPLDLEMTSALLRASQPGTLPLSYVAGDRIWNFFQNCASWRCMFATHVDIACFQTLKPQDTIHVKKDHICCGQIVDSASRPQKTTFFVSGPDEETFVGISLGKMLCETLLLEPIKCQNAIPYDLDRQPNMFSQIPKMRSCAMMRCVSNSSTQRLCGSIQNPAPSSSLLPLIGVCDAAIQVFGC